MWRDLGTCQAVYICELDLGTCTVCSRTSAASLRIQVPERKPEPWAVGLGLCQAGSKEERISSEGEPSATAPWSPLRVPYLLCPPLTPLAALHCLELGLLGKGNQYPSSQSIWNPLSSGWETSRGLGCRTLGIKQLQLTSLRPASSQNAQRHQQFQPVCQDDLQGPAFHIHTSV